MEQNARRAEIVKVGERLVVVRERLMQIGRLFDEAVISGWVDRDALVMSLGREHRALSDHLTTLCQQEHDAEL